MVADIVTDMEMEVYMVDDIEVDKVDDKVVADMAADNNKKLADMESDMVADMEVDKVSDKLVNIVADTVTDNKKKS